MADAIGPRPSWRERLASARWLPWLTLLAGFTGTGGLWLSVVADERAEAITLAALAARSTATALDANMRGYADSLLGIARRTGPALAEEGRWQIGIKGMSAVAWLAPTGRIGWVLPAGSPAAGLEDAPASETDRTTMLAAVRTRAPTFTSPEPAAGGGLGFRLFVPVFAGDELAGFLAGRFETRILYPTLIRDIASGLAIELTSGEVEVWRQGTFASGVWLAEAVTAGPGPRLRVRVGLAADAGQGLGLAPAAALAAGLIATLLLAAALALAQAASRRAREAERARQALSSSEARYRELFESNPHPMWVYDLETLAFLAVNDAAVAHYGYARDEFLAMTIAGIRPREDVPRLLDHLARGSEGLDRAGAWRHVRKDGETIEVEVTSHALAFDGRSAELVLAHDVTERQRAEMALRRANRALRTISECNQALVRASDERQLLDDICRLVVDHGGYRLAWVGFAERDEARSVRPAAQAGIEAGYLASAGISWADTPHGRGPTGTAIRERRPVVCHDIAADPAYAPWRAAAQARGYAASIALPLLAGEGDCLGALNIYSSEEGAFGGEEVALLTELANDLAYGLRSLRDRGALGAAESRQAATARRLGQLLASSPTVIYSLRAAGGGLELSEVSDNVERVLGCSVREALHPGWWSARLHPEDRKAALQAASTLPARGHLSHEYRFAREDGGYIWVHDEVRLTHDAEGRPLEAVGTWTDVSSLRRAQEERHQLQAELLQVQKLDSLGRLAGGIAHDFNNMLGVIVGRVEMAERRESFDARLRRDLAEIRKAAERSSGLTRQLLGFARKQTIQPRRIDVNEAVSGMLGMLRRLIGEDVALAFVGGHSLPAVRIDPSQLDQVLVNLCVNARDAIAGAGRITIETGIASVPELTSLRRQPVGEHVLLSVKDDGAGMDEETLSHMFEPFFTTKAPGKGTGLGLATVYGIVKQNAGYLAVESRPEHGTTFRIFLPFASGEADEAPAVADRPLPRGSETVLLVEDESALLEIAREALQDLGYRVHAASSAAEALGLASRQPEPIHLLLTDVVMPEVNGRELADSLRAQRPGLRCLFMSGYPADVIATRGVLEAGVNLLQKPYTAKQLAEAVRKVLDS
ncbi:MAG: GAF domain-containing protein [Vicinamibacteria bacterium]